MHFTKYQGLGNDFILIEDFEEKLLPRAGVLARRLCRRRWGIGADGLVLITLAAGLYTMRIFNPDGSEAEMCGNAIRCLAHHLLRRGLVEGTVIFLGTVSGSKQIKVSDLQYTVAMGSPDFSFNGGKALEFSSHGQTWLIHPVSLGNPHGVVFLEDLQGFDFAAWGPRLEQASFWPQGANIEFVQVLSPSQLKVRVWERGAGATLACGSGACAALAAAVRLGLAEEKAVVSMPGGDLKVEWKKGEQVFMTGPAVQVFSGSVDPDQIREEN